MPTKKMPANNINLLRAARANLTDELKKHLPKITEANLQKVYDSILSYQPLRNAIIPSMIQRIGIQTVDSNAWRNPLARFRKAPMRYGATHEETYVNMCRGRVYDPLDSYENAFRVYESYIMTVFHTINYSVQYPVTITFDNLRNAFLDEYGIRTLIDAKMESAITGANWDEYLATKGLIDTGYEKRLIPAVHVEEVVNETSAKALLGAVKTAAYQFGFPNPMNNIAGATSASRKSNLVWITTPQVSANVSVEALAYAFNLDKADVEVQTIIVDNFDHPEIQGVLADVRFFNVREQFREMTEQRLANILSWNFLYTVVELISPSPFYPIRVFTTDTIVEDVTITANAVTYIPGVDTKLNAAVETASGDTGTYLREAIEYEITSQPTSKNTCIIPGTPILVTGVDETSEITIKASYRPNTNVNTTFTATKNP